MEHFLDSSVDLFFGMDDGFARPILVKTAFDLFRPGLLYFFRAVFNRAGIERVRYFQSLRARKSL
jgi:hypothetical protein